MATSEPQAQPLPCSSCGKQLATVRLPALPVGGGVMLRSLLRSLGASTTDVTGLDGATISGALFITCLECAR